MGVYSGNPVRSGKRTECARFLEQPGEEPLKSRISGKLLPGSVAGIKDQFRAANEVRAGTWSHHFRDDRHQDHRVLSDLAWNAFRDHLI